MRWLFFCVMWLFWDLVFMMSSDTNPVLLALLAALCAIFLTTIDLILVFLLDILSGGDC